MKLKKVIYIIVGFIGLGLGVIGAILPLMPAFPFLLLAAYSFAKSSTRLHNWFVGTKIYKNNLENYIKGRGMTTKTKIKMVITITIVMAIGFIMMRKTTIGRTILCVVWLFHVIYFTFGIKTIKDNENKED